MNSEKNVSIAKDVDRAAGIVFHQGNLLLMQRRNRGKEYYTFPGGGIEVGESKEDAIVREIWEETSIKVVPQKLLYTVEWNKRNLQYFYLCSYISGIPALGDFIEKETMRTNPEQYYNPLWVSLGEVEKLLLYPLEVKDILLEDYKKEFEAEPRTFALDIATCRQEL